MAETKMLKNSKLIYWIIGIVVFICYSFILFPPLTKLINKVEPFVFGLPFFAFMELALALIVAGMLVLLFQVQNKRGDL